MTIIAITSRLETHICANCGMQFAAPEHWVDKHCRGAGNPIYCPAGHNLTFGKSIIDKANDEAAEARRRQAIAEAQAKQEREQREAAQAELERTKQRVGQGTCPCCKRHFKALRRHMACKHPGYKDPVKK